MAEQPTVAFELGWSEARALAYAADTGIKSGKWTDENYERLAMDARRKLLDAITATEQRIETALRRQRRSSEEKA